MKGLPIAILALAFAFFSLLSLLTAARDSDSTNAFSADGPPRVSEVGLRVTFQHP
ncbi:MAG TPA: hypothetical protein VF452_03510 [Candidatus Binatia bacterium]|jgi:hypothetical protein